MIAFNIVAFCMDLAGKSGIGNSFMYSNGRSVSFHYKIRFVNLTKTKKQNHVCIFVPLHNRTDTYRHILNFGIKSMTDKGKIPQMIVQISLCSSNKNQKQNENFLIHFQSNRNEYSRTREL